MKRMILVAALISTVLGSSFAQGIIGTSKSFSTTTFCKTYKCSLVSKEDNIWMYKTKFGDLISIMRKSADPASKITKAILGIPNFDHQYYPEDNRTFSALQVEIFGSSKVKLSDDCYYSGDFKLMNPVANKGVAYNVGCLSQSGAMLIMIGSPN